MYAVASLIGFNILGVARREDLKIS